MKRIFFLTSLLLCILLLPACLVYKQVNVTITFDEHFKTGKIEVEYVDIVSSDSSQKKQQGDFEDLIEMLEDDEFLLDSVNDGIYVKERRLFESNGRLNGYYSGIFRKLKLDGEELNEKGEERVLHIDTDEDDLITSNGKIYQSKDNSFIIWPKNERKLIYSIKKKYSQAVYSLLPYYKSK